MLTNRQTTRKASSLRQMALVNGLIGVLATPLPAAGQVGTQVAPTIIDPDATVAMDTAVLKTWREGNRDKCLMPEEAPTSQTEQLLDKFYGYIRQSPLAERLYQDLSSSSFTLCAEDAWSISEDAAAEYLYGPNAALIKSESDKVGRVVLSGLHEMRHGWQDSVGLIDQMLAETKQNRFAALYMVEADAAAFSVAAAYELKQAGSPEAWEAAQKGKYYKFLAQAFERGIGFTPDGVKPTDTQIRRGMKAAYNAWFDQSDLDESYTKRHLAEWGDAPDSGVGRAVSIRQLGQEIGRLPGTAGRQQPSYIGVREITKAEDRANTLVERQQASPRDNLVGNPLLWQSDKSDGPKRMIAPGSSSGAL